MDKYTVDLDKVLNDFEYSELTEQYTSGGSGAAYRPVGPKHSINNVFHSLNEYLNTEIPSHNNNNNTNNNNNSSHSLVSDSELEELEQLEHELEQGSKSLHAELQQLQTPTYGHIQNTAVIQPIKQQTDEITPQILGTVDYQSKQQLTSETVEYQPETYETNVNTIIEESESETIACDDQQTTKTIEYQNENVVETTDSQPNENETIASPQQITKTQAIVETIECRQSETKPAETIECKPSETIDFQQASETIEHPQENIVNETTNEHQETNGSSSSCETIACDEVVSETVASCVEVKEEEEKETVECDNNRIIIVECDKQENVVVNVVNSVEEETKDEKTEGGERRGSVRPNSLELNEEPPPPAIDLIGAPGSTPYNNTWSSLGPADASDSASSPASPSSSSGSRDTSLEADTPTPPSAGIGGANASNLGATAPFWTPDTDTPSCLHCSVRFTVLRRRHHCRACGLVLCARCCSLRAHLAYLGAEARVCSKCFPLLQGQQGDGAGPTAAGLPRPGNPMDYCSTVSPLLQAAAAREPPTVMVPQSVLKRQGSAKSRGGKSVTFMDGVRPGSELAEEPGTVGRVSSAPPWPVDPGTGSYLPSDAALLPPRATRQGPELIFTEQANNSDLVEELKEQMVTFAINRNFLVHCKIVNLDCCMNTNAWCFTSEGLMCVGQDEIVILLEVETSESTLPRDILLHFQHIYNEASRGHSLPELGLSLHPNSSFLGSPRHAGMLYIRPTFQCLQRLVLPVQQPYLVGLLVHRWETPWAKMFPLRLVLRLGAHYRYYPAPLLSTRGRDSVYVEIGHTIINLLADFRNYSYTLPTVRGLTIHMEAGMTSVLMPRNRYEQVARALANSSEHIVALGAAFSRQADAHLVCLQDTQRRDAYSTHAINIHNKPRKITGASFIVLNGALKASSGLIAKSSIVEDGVMVQLQSGEMAKLRASLLAMRDHRVQCGPSTATPADTVAFLWTGDDTDFNQGVTSPIDGISLQGIPSVRVHNGRDHLAPSSRRCIRWTEVFLLQNTEEDVSRISECISRAAAAALGRYLDLLASSGQTRLGVRATLSLDSVSYLAGGNGSKLPPLYMNSLDSELVPVLHRLSQDLPANHTLVLELIFHILYT